MTVMCSIFSCFHKHIHVCIHTGSGKTTLLDVLTGRRKTDGVTVSSTLCGVFIRYIGILDSYATTQGSVFINGIPIEENYDWYSSNMGYVLQLAVPYYEELTVRENLTLAAWVKLHDSTREKFERVEQVMDVVRDEEMHSQRKKEEKGEKEGNRI